MVKMSVGNGKGEHFDARITPLLRGAIFCHPAGDPHGTTVYRGLRYAHIVNTPSSRRRPGSSLCSESLDPGLRRDDEKAASGSGFVVRPCKPTSHLYNARAQPLAFSLQERWVRCMTVSQQ
jgi:hypothetical protein